jgi:tetratricopeptide repeat protein
MQGMEIAEKYYEQYGLPMVREVCPELEERAAFGLVGEGSQCFGYDDEISRDHDFGPGFCIWLLEDDFANYGGRLQAAYEMLPKEFMGLSTDNIQDKSRVGVMPIDEFFFKYLGLSETPKTNREWLFLKETSLALCTNGKVFQDDAGRFTAFRREILAFYPEDILRKKLAARAAVMSQAGQYNLLRCLDRNDRVAAMLALAKFTEASISMVYLLNRRYMPFYKWAYHGMQELPEMRQAVEKIGELGTLFEGIGTGCAAVRKKSYELTECICEDTARELNKQGFSQCSSAFLQNHLGEIMEEICDPQIRSLPPIYDYGF